MARIPEIKVKIPAQIPVADSENQYDVFVAKQTIPQIIVTAAIAICVNPRK